MSGIRLTGFESLAGSIRLAGNRARAAPRRMPGWLVSWRQVGPLAIVPLLLFAVSMLLFLAVSFFDYDRVGIYPAFILDSHHDVFTNPATYERFIGGHNVLATAGGPIAVLADRCRLAGAAEEPHVSGRVAAVEYQGALVRVSLVTEPGDEVSALVPEAVFYAQPVQPGDPATLVWSQQDTHHLSEV